MMKNKKKTVFNTQELESLPLTYRNMECSETANIGELYNNSVFSKSTKHATNQYMVFASYKPYSNFIIDENEI